MNTKLTAKAILGHAAAAALLFPTIGCDVKKTQDGEMPAVQVEGGKLPEYDVDAADVTVDTKKTEVTVPKVTSEKKEITVPDIDVKMPDEKKATPAAPNRSEAPATPATPAPPQ